MRKCICLVLLVLSGFVVYSLSGDNAVAVMGAHYDGSTARILVNRLPFTESAKIDWWTHNQRKIREKCHIPSGHGGPFLITVYAFGEGYKEEKNEDRLCFNDITPPKNCIDKNILMLIWRTRDGGEKYQF